jgi:hypothetical protein
MVDDASRRLMPTRERDSSRRFERSIAASALVARRIALFSVLSVAACEAVPPDSAPPVVQARSEQGAPSAQPPRPTPDRVGPQAPNTTAPAPAQSSASASASMPVSDSAPALAPAPVKAPPPAVEIAAPTILSVKPVAPTVDLRTLKSRLEKTKAIGLLTKLALKNQVDDLLDRFREYYEGTSKLSLVELRRSYELLMMKVLSLLQDEDATLASAVVASRETIWAMLSDSKQFAALDA